MDKYERYRLLWMLAHGYTLQDLMNELTEKQSDIDDPDPLSSDVNHVFKTWEHETGFGGEIWACREEWEECEANEAMD